MDEKTRHKRALEDISHFFLSGDQTRRPPEKFGEQGSGENPAGKVPPSEGENKEAGDSAEEKARELIVARPVASVIENKGSLVRAVKEYLHSAHDGDLAVVKNMDFARFGTADLTLFDKKKFCVLCGKIQGDTGFSDFLTAAMGFYGWLSDCLQAGGLFFNKSPGLDLYLFCERCPSTAPFIVEKLTAAMSIRLVRYHLLQVPDNPTPIVYFQSLVPADGNGMNQEKQTPDLTEDDWRHFNRLKQRASEE